MSKQTPDLMTAEQFTSNCQQIKALTVCKIKTAENQELRQKRIAAASKHLDALRRFANIAPGYESVREAMTLWILAQESELVGACTA